MSDMIRWLYLLAAFYFYYEGFLCFQEKIGVMAVAMALISVVALLLFFHRAWSRHYLNMSMKKVDKLEGRAFEKYLMVQFRHLGYRVTLTDASHDYGADLILKKHGEIIVVQAKRYRGNVGIAAVQEVVGSIAYYGADRAMVVTNSHFTKSAKNLARQNDVELWGREQIQYNFKI